MVFSPGQSNPSVLTKVESFAAAADVDATFLMQETRLFTGLFVQPFRHLVIGLMVAHHGSTDYTQSTLSLLMNRNLGKVQVGAEFLFHHSMITGYSSSATIDAGINCRMELSPVFNAGFRLRNLSGLLFEKENSFAPVVQAGAGYDISNAILLGCEWLQEAGRAPIVTTGILYRFHSLFVLIVGINWSPGQPYGGFQLNYHQWKLLVKTSFHPALGWTPAIGISFGKVNQAQE